MQPVFDKPGSPVSTAFREQDLGLEQAPSLSQPPFRLCFRQLEDPKLFVPSGLLEVIIPSTMTLLLPISPSASGA